MLERIPVAILDFPPVQLLLRYCFGHWQFSVDDQRMWRWNGRAWESRPASFDEKQDGNAFWSIR